MLLNNCYELLNFHTLWDNFIMHEFSRSIHHVRKVCQVHIWLPSHIFLFFYLWPNFGWKTFNVLLYTLMIFESSVPRSRQFSLCSNSCSLLLNISNICHERIELNNYRYFHTICRRDSVTCKTLVLWYYLLWISIQAWQCDMQNSGTLILLGMNIYPGETVWYAKLWYFDTIGYEYLSRRECVICKILVLWYYWVWISIQARQCDMQNSGTLILLGMNIYPGVTVWYAKFWYFDTIGYEYLSRRDSVICKILVLWYYWVWISIQAWQCDMQNSGTLILLGMNIYPGETVWYAKFWYFDTIGYEYLSRRDSVICKTLVLWYYWVWISIQAWQCDMQNSCTLILLGMNIYPGVTVWYAKFWYFDTIGYEYLSRRDSVICKTLVLWYYWVWISIQARQCDMQNSGTLILLGMNIYPGETVWYAKFWYFDTIGYEYLSRRDSVICEILVLWYYLLWISIQARQCDMQNWYFDTICYEYLSRRGSVICLSIGNTL